MLRALANHDDGTYLSMDAAVSGLISIYFVVYFTVLSLLQDRNAYGILVEKSETGYV